jgi:uncharacterized protein YjbI with pentapeptide repeats
MANKQVQRMTLAKLIQAKRKSTGLNMKEFGDLIEPKVSQPSVSRWEKGVIPDEKYWPSLAKVLEISLENIHALTKPESVANEAGTEIKAVKYANVDLRHVAVLNRGVNVWNTWREKNPHIVPELAGVCPKVKDLIGYDLRGVDLSRADLSGVNLTKVNLFGANLYEANLTGAIVENANFQMAQLEGISLREARGDGANFQEAIMVRAHLENAQLAEARLFSANLQGAYLTSTNLRGADLQKTQLQGARLRLADLRLANLNFARCEGLSIKKCLVYGLSCFGLELSNVDQKDLNIDPRGDANAAASNIVQDLRLASLLSLFPYQINNRLVKEVSELMQEVIREDTQESPRGDLERLLFSPYRALQTPETAPT